VSGVVCVSWPQISKNLERQLGFLRRSCESYDAGYTDESVRIATTTRVLVHDTKRCISLLKHLGGLNIKLAGTVSVSNIPSSRIVMLSGMGPSPSTPGPPCLAEHGNPRSAQTTLRCNSQFPSGGTRLFTSWEQRDAVGKMWCWRQPTKTVGHMWTRNLRRITKP
jgi:hypothetical protein